MLLYQICPSLAKKDLCIPQFTILVNFHLFLRFKPIIPPPYGISNIFYDIIHFMQYNTVHFIIFFTVFLLIYLSQTTVRMRKIILLIGNLFFYTFNGDGSCLLLLLAISLITYADSIIMGLIYRSFEKNTKDLSKKEKQAALIRYKHFCLPILLIGLFFVLSILIYTKIGGLLQWERVSSFKEFHIFSILVPLGLSYFTFSCVGYLLDIYWRKAVSDFNYLNLLLAVSFFPTIVQGPITRYSQLLKQYNNLPSFDYERVTFGLQRMIWGAIKKLVVADRLAVYSSAVFGSVIDYAGIEIVLATAANVLSLYADFSGCMDIVIGASECIGISLDENFQQPFFAKNAAEFWRRWHITLGVWFKDYVYMPIAMNPRFTRSGRWIRKHVGKRASSAYSTAIPLLITWFLTGLWHGTGTDYIIWGFYWGTLILIGAVFAPEFKRLLSLLHISPSSISYRLFQMIRTFILFGIGRLLTATGSLDGFYLTIQRLFKESRLWVLFDDSLYTHGLDRKEFYVALFGIILIWISDYMHEKKICIRKCIAQQVLPVRWFLYIGSIVFVIIFGWYGSAFDATSFAYGAF